MSDAPSVKLDPQDKDQVDRLAGRLGVDRKWIVGEMIRSRSDDDWLRVIGYRIARLGDVTGSADLGGDHGPTDGQALRLDGQPTARSRSAGVGLPAAP